MRGKSEIVGAVDFGSRDVRVLIARKDGDGAIQVIGHGASAGHGCVSQGVIQDLSAVQACLREALREKAKVPWEYSVMARCHPRRTRFLSIATASG